VRAGDFCSWDFITTEDLQCFSSSSSILKSYCCWRVFASIKEKFLSVTLVKRRNSSAAPELKTSIIFSIISNEERKIHISEESGLIVVSMQD